MSDAKVYLDLYEHSKGYYTICWYIDEETGAFLGEDEYTEEQMATADAESRDHILATIVASQTNGVERNETGYYWRSLKHARGALKAVKAAIEGDTGEAWPEWAVKAQAAGWKAPKGWKP